MAPASWPTGMAAADPHVRVRHRAAKQGLGKAYIDGFGVAMQEGAARIVQMDADWSHSPDYLPALLAALTGGAGAPRTDGADLAIGSRYVAGGGVLDWGIGRKVVSRGGSIFARTVLRLKPHDLTGGFKAWRREALEAIEWRRRPLGRLRLPDRDDLPRQPGRRARGGGAHRLHRPPRRCQQDVAPHHRRGPPGGAPAALGGAAWPWAAARLGVAVDVELDGRRRRRQAVVVASVACRASVAAGSVRRRDRLMGRLADLGPAPLLAPGATHLVMDLRPLQEPERSPVTAAYLGHLLEAFALDPLPGEDIVAMLRARRPDPTHDLAERGLVVAGRRWLPPTARVLRSTGLTIDSVLLRGAQVRTGSGGLADGVVGTVYHTAGGAIPVASPLPVVATLLDLAPWELPHRYARTAAARLGHRMRARALRRASRVVVCSRATAEAAIRLLELPPESVSVVPLAADDAFHPGAADAATMARLRDAYDLPERFLVVGGRYDARSDLLTVLAAVGSLRGTPVRTEGDDPPMLVLAGAAGTDASSRSRVAALVDQLGVSDLVRLTPPLPVTDLAALEAAAVGHVQAALSDATGLGALEALASGTPVICSRTGPLPEVVGSAGIIVEPHDEDRMATAIAALWSDGPVARQVRRAAQARAGGTAPALGGCGAGDARHLRGSCCHGHACERGHARRPRG